MGNIGKHFNRSEFACKCGCGKDDINPELITKLDEIRDAMGEPLTVHSGCRCEEYNKKVGGEQNSAHTRGNAADIGMNGSSFRYIFLRLAFGKFKRIGVYKTFCHVDVDNTLPEIVCWTGK